MENVTRVKRSKATLTYGLVDLVLAALYVYVFLFLVPSRSALFTTIAIIFALIMAAGGVGMLIKQSWGRSVAKWSARLMLLACAVLIALLLASTAYLHGIYGGVGQAGVVLGSIATALVFQFVGLVPALQLAHLRRTRHGH